jgi:hypothetical protein
MGFSRLPFAISRLTVNESSLYAFQVTFFTHLFFDCRAGIWAGKSGKS